jgi:hypothetical protein
VTTTVRSVRVELEMGIASYVANAKIAGRETDKAFKSAEARVSATSRAVSRLERNMANLSKTSAEARVGQSSLGQEVDNTGAATERTSRRTKTYTLEMALADEKAARLRKSLRDQASASLDAESGLGRLEKQLDKTGSSASRTERAIDKYSGRLRTLAEAALVVGPGLNVLGAGIIPALTASLAGLGAAAGGIGVAVLAFKGIGDGIKALDTYQLAPTAENLQALRVEMEKLGPAGAQFAHFVDGLEPTLRNLQNTARAGLFPGVEIGIDYLLDRLPEVQKIINRLSQGMGDLAHEAGRSLGGPDFDAFFRYIETDARPTLEAFGHSLGNVALGMANLLVAFAPLSRDFTSGLEGATKAFADWSKGLDDNKSFQSFLSYVRESGPQVVDLLGALAGAFAGLIHASAPLGKAVVPALTALARAFGVIGNSSIGGPLYTAAAALVLFNRTASLTNKAATSISSSFKKLGTDATTVQSRLSVLGARGGVILAAGVAAGALADSIDRIDPTNLERSLTALKFGDVTDEINKVIDSIGFLESKWNKGPDFGEVFTAGGLFGDDTRDKMQNNVDQVDQMLAQMVEAGNKVEASGIFKQISDLASAKGIDPSKTAANFDAYQLALKNVAAAAGDGSGKVDEFGNAVKGASGALDGGTSSAQRFSDALAGLNGWFDRRQALRDYSDALHTLTKGLKDGFGRKDIENLDAAGRSILQVAQGIKDPGLRTDFLANARASLAKLADDASPRAQRAIQRVITEMDSQGLTKPHLIPLSVDDKASPTLDQLGIHLRRTGALHPTPRVTVDAGNSIPLLDQLAHLLGSLHDRTITVTTNHVGGVTSSAGGHSVSAPGGADGMTVPGARHPYGDKVLAHLAPGEEVISNRHGQADQFRADRAAGRIPAYANGGTVADRSASTHTTRAPADPFFTLGDSADSAAHGLKGLKAEADKVSKSLEKQKSKLDDLISQRDSTASSIASAALHDPFGNGVAGLDAQVSADQGDLDAMRAALATLVKNGLDPHSALYQQLAAHMDVNTAQQLAQLSSSDLQAQATRFQQVQTSAAAFGGQIAGQEFNEAIRDQTKATRELRSTLKDLNQEIQQIGDHVRKGAHEGTKDGAQDVGDQVFTAVKDGNDDRRRRTSTAVRTGSR